MQEQQITLLFLVFLLSDVSGGWASVNEVVEETDIGAGDRFVTIYCYCQ